MQVYTQKEMALKFQHKLNAWRNCLGDWIVTYEKDPYSFHFFYGGEPMVTLLASELCWTLTVQNNNMPLEDFQPGMDGFTAFLTALQEINQFVHELPLQKIGKTWKFESEEYENANDDSE